MSCYTTSPTRNKMVPSYFRRDVGPLSGDGCATPLAGAVAPANPAPSRDLSVHVQAGADRACSSVDRFHWDTFPCFFFRILISRYRVSDIFLACSVLQSLYISDLTLYLRRSRGGAPLGSRYPPHVISSEGRFPFRYSLRNWDQ